MQFTDDRDQPGVVQTLTALVPAFGVGLVFALLAAAANAAFLDVARIAALEVPAAVRMGLAGMGLLCLLAALVSWSQRFSRALWFPTLLIPSAALWDLGLEGRQFDLVNLAFRTLVIDAAWRTTVGGLVLFSSYSVAAWLLGRPLGPPLTHLRRAVGFCAVYGLQFWAVQFGAQLLLPAVIVVAACTFVLPAAFFDDTRAVLPNAFRALARAPLGVLVAWLGGAMAFTAPMGVQSALGVMRGQDVMRTLFERPSDFPTLFVSESVYTTTVTFTALVLLAIWSARELTDSSGEESPEEPDESPPQTIAGRGRVG